MGFGTASTSCSFGDIAATKTLFKKGAHIIPAVAFKIASTNLVIGLSFVIWALLGWQFMLAQAIGAPVFILIAIVLVHLWIPYDETREADGNIVASLAGGYGIESGLPYPNLAVVAGLLGWDTGNVREPKIYDPPRETPSVRDVIREVRQAHRDYWDLSE